MVLLSGVLKCSNWTSPNTLVLTETTVPQIIHLLIIIIWGIFRRTQISCWMNYIFYDIHTIAGYIPIFLDDSWLNPNCIPCTINMEQHNFQKFHGCSLLHSPISSHFASSLLVFHMNSMKFHQLCIPWNPMKSYEIPTKTTPNHCDGSPKMCPFKEMPTLTPVLRVEVNGMSGMAGWVKKKLPFSNPLGFTGIFRPNLVQIIS